MSQTCASFRVRVQSLKAKQILRKENLAKAVFTGGGELGERNRGVWGPKQRADPGLWVEFGEVGASRVRRGRGKMRWEKKDRERETSTAPDRGWGHKVGRVPDLLVAGCLCFLHLSSWLWFLA